MLFRTPHDQKFFYIFFLFFAHKFNEEKLFIFQLAADQKIDSRERKKNVAK